MDKVRTVWLRRNWFGILGIAIGLTTTAVFSVMQLRQARDYRNHPPAPRIDIQLHREPLINGAIPDLAVGFGNVDLLADEGVWPFLVTFRVSQIGDAAIRESDFSTSSPWGLVVRKTTKLRSLGSEPLGIDVSQGPRLLGAFVVADSTADNRFVRHLKVTVSADGHIVFAPHLFAPGEWYEVQALLVAGDSDRFEYVSTGTIADVPKPRLVEHEAGTPEPQRTRADWLVALVSIVAAVLFVGWLRWRFNAKLNRLVSHLDTLNQVTENLIRQAAKMPDPPDPADGIAAELLAGDTAGDTSDGDPEP